ncbi:unnamed protein product [Vitrella brassicaformis CCMP3155]|uniref:Dynein axonemal intermediate chain 4 n=2 Tax=Vitrella brassicaformis TaxID=1169539 RepID=A0A0G4ESC6_VITBC|nr:unnamed protein product [Vitrella brassicaformis CCMP3155]|eukprot:CEM01530.1 unnamed protein product [Vitrella brassicaformis CCMP3155]
MSQPSGVPSQSSLRGRPDRQAPSTLPAISSKTRLGAGSSKTLGAGGSSTLSRSKMKSSSTDAAGGGEVRVVLNGKDVTPRSLVAFAHAAGELTTPDIDKERTLGDVGEDLAELDEGLPGEPKGLSMAFLTTKERPKDKTRERAGLSPEELEKPVAIVLEETPTMTFFHQPSLCVALDSEEYSVVSSRNKVYDELIKSHEDADKFNDHHCQTLNLPQKVKEVMAAPPHATAVGVTASPFEIFNAFAQDPVPKHEELQMAYQSDASDLMSKSISKPGTLVDVNAQPAEGPRLGTRLHKHEKGGPQGPLSATLSAQRISKESGMSLTVPKASFTKASRQQQQQQQGLDRVSVSSGSQKPPSEAGVSDTPEQQRKKAIKEGEGTDKDDAASDLPLKEQDAMPWLVGADEVVPAELNEALRVMERIVSQNVFHDAHMIYRNYPTLEELQSIEEACEKDFASSMAAANRRRSTRLEKSGVVAARDAAAEREREANGGGGEHEEGEEDVEGEEAHGGGKVDQSAPRLEDLFCFECPNLTKDMSVTCAEWNVANQDLLAVGYGEMSAVPTEGLDGLVLFWSLKNPTYPERVLKTKTGVTGLHFSSVHPNLVAAGTHDGTVAIWDLRRPQDQPILESGASISANSDRKHTDVVWDLKWVDQGADKVPREFLASVSSDGRVYQWKLKKGLEQSLLMALKRLSNPRLGGTNVKEGVIFRQASGMCMDFPRGDSSTYLIGTEDGLIHRCSTSYNEQYLDTYYGHSGPVYRVRFNDFWPEAFLSCSADWTIKLWTLKHTEGPVATFQSTDLFDAVNGLTWSPHNATAFAAAMSDGRVEVWDLSMHILDPMVVHYPGKAHGRENRRRTAVRFALNSPVLVAGDDHGGVEVMRMYNMETPNYSIKEQQDRLMAVVHAQKKK